MCMCFVCVPFSYYSSVPRCLMCFLVGNCRYPLAFLAYVFLYVSASQYCSVQLHVVHAVTPSWLLLGNILHVCLLCFSGKSPLSC